MDTGRQAAGQTAGDDARDGRDLFIGLDLGTSSLKGVAVTAGGEIAARGHAAYETRRDEPGQAEQDPGDWVAALKDVAGQLGRQASPARWAGIGLSAMIPTLVATDPDGNAVWPAVTWEDARAEAHGEAFRAAAGEAGGGPDRLYAHTGQWVDGRYLLPMWQRAAEVHGVPAAQTPMRVLGAKDYLFWLLTGELMTDPSTASGFGCYSLEGDRWLPDVLAVAGLDAAQLPPVLPSQTVRPLAPVAAAAFGLPPGLPVCLGAADSVLGALALGVTAPGDVAYITGTSSVILGVADAPLPDPRHRYLVTPMSGPDGWGLEMDLLSTGSAVAWLTRLLGLGEGAEDKLLRLAATAAERESDDASAPLLMPFLSGGEQGALWDPQLRGSVLGLDLANDGADLALALIDGIVLESRRCLAVLSAAGLPGGALIASGSGAASPFFRQRLADASGRQVLYGGAERPLSALGAAAVAAQALGRAPDLAAWNADASRVSPDPGQGRRWEARWARHERAVARLQELYREI